MSDESVRTAGILLVVYPTVVFGGASLLCIGSPAAPPTTTTRCARRMWRAGHAHAGALLLRSLVALQLVDRVSSVTAGSKSARTTIPAATDPAPDRHRRVDQPPGR